MGSVHEYDPLIGPRACGAVPSTCNPQNGTAAFGRYFACKAELEEHSDALSRFAISSHEGKWCTLRTISWQRASSMHSRAGQHHTFMLITLQVESDI